MGEIKVVFIHGLSPELVQLIASFAPPDLKLQTVEGGSSLEGQIRAVREADFIMLYRARLADPVLKEASGVRLIQLLAAGYDDLNLELIRQLSIPCATNSGVNSWAVADHAVLLMLALYHRLVLVDRATREGRWREPLNGLNTYEMDGKLVGILGIGNIGTKVSRRVQAFGARVQYHDMYPLSPEREKEEQVTRVSLQQLFQSSDIVTCHAPLTPQTQHLISREQLALMKSTAILINTSRGRVVDEVALIEALREGRIAGAGLDVFEKEPVPTDNPLLTMDNVVVTPHSAGTTSDTWRRRAEFAYQNITRVWGGEGALALIPNSGG